MAIIDRDCREIATVKENPMQGALTPCAKSLIIFKELESNVELFDDMLRLVANGGSLIACSDKIGVPYSDLSIWMNATEERRVRFKAAVDSRGEWVVARILDELQAIGLCDVKQLFKDDGTMKAMKDIPDAVSRCIGSIEVEEANDFHGRIKKVRMIDKIRGIEVLIKGLQGFVEKKELKIEHSYRVEGFDIEERLRIIKNATEAQVVKIETDDRPDDGPEPQDI